jgi:ethanolamine utilization protein EutQ
MELDKKTLEDVVRTIIREELGKAPQGDGRQVDPSGVIGIDPKNVALEDFPFPVGAVRVTLKDVFTVEESPRLGAGIMELDHTSLDWTLTYDEIDYVISGTLEIIIDGRKVKATEGQMIYIPKNTSISFSTPDKTRFLYVVYPANWADLV